VQISEKSWDQFPEAEVTQTPEMNPLNFALRCEWGDCPLLKGTPQTAGLHSALVRLKTFQTQPGGEKSSVILKGQGKALINEQVEQPFAAPKRLVHGHVRLPHA
jgi:hypothetical protein